MPLNKILRSRENYPDFISNRVKNYYMERVINTWSAGHIMRGRMPTPNDIVLTSNDYLCIGSDRGIKLTQSNAIMHESHENMMSAVFINNDTVQGQAEEGLAALSRSESAIITQSGWSANTGLLQVIADESTPVYIDFFAHMSLWEGIKISGAKAVPFRHNDPLSLASMIKKHGPGIVIVDSVYSTDGDVCPLKDVVAVSESNGCVMIVDESHSLGTHGPEGAGLVVEYGLEDKVHFITASLAKAFASRAGVITCSEEFKDYFIYTANQSIFSSALLKHEYHALNQTIKTIKAASKARKDLHSNASIIRDNLSRIGYNVDSSKSQIISLESGSEKSTIKLRDSLESRGIFGSVFCAPATPTNRAKIRFSVNSALTHNEISRLIHVCEEIKDEVNMHEWSSTKRKRPSSYALTA